MHLLARLEGRDLPDVPPLAPRPQSDMRSELRALEGVLSDALNRVRGEGGSNHSMLMRLAHRLIDQLDEDRRSRTSRYADPEHIYEQIARGDVILIRASWLLQRAGFRPIGPKQSSQPTPEADADGGAAATAAAAAAAAAAREEWLRGVRAWVPREPPKPLPRRQEIERDHRDAIMPLEDLRRYGRQFAQVASEAASVASGVARASSAEEDGVEAMAVVSVSHCWEVRARMHVYIHTSDL